MDTLSQAPTETPYARMRDKIDGMPDDQLTSVWRSLCRTEWGWYDLYDPGGGISMDEWAQNVESEMHRRGLPTNT